MTANLNFEKVKPYLLPIIALIVLVILVPLIIMPWVSDVQTGFGNMGTSQTKLTAMQAKADALDKMDGQTNKQLLQQKVEPAIPSEADPAGVLGTLEQVAITSGATAKAVQFGQGTGPSSPSAAAAGKDEVSTNLTVQGSYANIATFIAQSEAVARVVSINSLHIVPAADGSAALLATFSVSAPYQPLLDDLGPAEEPLPEQTAAKTKTLEAISKLHAASYAPTTLSEITGKQNPF